MHEETIARGTPAGFRDILAEEALVRERTIRAVQDLFAAEGYVPIETPTLEVMDTLAHAITPTTFAPFRFFDSQGDLLAMRPDVTPQVARMYAARLAEEHPVLRLRYTQRVFREAEGKAHAASREFTQIGVECIGEAGSRCDAEIVRLFARALEAIGVTDYTIALATVGVLRTLLEASNAPARWKEQVLEAYHRSNFVEVDRLVAWLVEEDGAEETEKEIARAIKDLPRRRGGREAIEELRGRLAAFGVDTCLDVLLEAYDSLASAGLENHLLIDFSVMSSFDYYTGIVFEAYAAGSGTPLGSGGRYDTMLARYGTPRPAAGFAFSLEESLASSGASSKTTNGEVASGASDSPAARPSWLCPMQNMPVACSGRSIAVRQSTEGVWRRASAHKGEDEAPEATVRRKLRIAVPKGSLAADTAAALEAAGLDTSPLKDAGRQLIVAAGDVEYVIVRPTDAPAFVALGAADCGICGKDSLLESALDVVELLDLGYGGCRFVVAEPAGAADEIHERYRKLGSLRVATKYPRITREHFAKSGTQVEIVELHGNIELAPLTGLADRIVDITATGTTLRENNLVIVEDVLPSTARFFANRCAFRTDGRVMALARALQKGR